MIRFPLKKKLEKFQENFICLETINNLYILIDLKGSNLTTL